MTKGQKKSHHRILPVDPVRIRRARLRRKAIKLTVVATEAKREVKKVKPIRKGNHKREKAAPIFGEKFRGIMRCRRPWMCNAPVILASEENDQWVIIARRATTGACESGLAKRVDTSKQNGGGKQGPVYDGT